MTALERIAATLTQAARATGVDQRRDLSGGARLAVRVRDGEVTLTIARSGAPVGERELEIFTRDCGVPAHALRIPAAGQQARVVEDRTWHLVAFRWHVGLFDD